MFPFHQFKVLLCVECTIEAGENNRPNIGQSGEKTAFFTRVADGLSETVLQARFEWSLLAFAVGIGVYFGWWHEPSLPGIAALLVLLAAMAMWLSKRIVLYEILVLILMGVAGFGRAALHTKAVTTSVLPERSYVITGWVEKLTTSGSFKTAYIRVHSIDKLSAAETPFRVRVRLKPYGVKPGEGIRIRAVLSPPPGPAVVGGYDTGRAAWFRRIGGFGYAISKVEKVRINPGTFSDRLDRILVRFRAGLSRRIQARAPPETAGLQAALLTGDRSAIPPEQAQVLRDAGLAHVLAISGLHMGILAGGAYVLLSWILAVTGPLARRYDMRKWAAGAAIFVASFYLLISGASISTQRAYIMAVIMFAAIILDRRAVSLRAVAVAATLTLLIHPESLLSTGFQMSFSATAALVVVYRYWADHRLDYNRRHMLARIRNGLVTLSLTSLVAGLATGGFAALGFHRFARYGFIGNLLAMPVFTLIVMPSGFIAVLLMPLGLEYWPLWLMGKGLDAVLSISGLVAGLDHAVWHFKSAGPGVLSLYGLGFAFLCLGPYRVRLAGLVTMGLALLWWTQTSRPDMRISEAGRIAFWDTSDINLLYVDRKRGDGFGRARFVERAGRPDARFQSYYDTQALCDALACRLRIKGKIVTVASEPQAVRTACAESDLVILTLRQAGPVARRQCNSVLIDGQSLAQGGAIELTFQGNHIRMQQSNPPKRRNRPWGGLPGG